MREIAGTALCKSPVGTGVNDSNRKPQSRFLSIGIDEHDVAGLLHGFGHIAQDGQSALIGGHIVNSAKSIQIVIEKTCRRGPLVWLARSLSS